MKKRTIIILIVVALLVSGLVYFVVIPLIRIRQITAIVLEMAESEDVPLVESTITTGLRKLWPWEIALFKKYIVAAKEGDWAKVDKMKPRIEPIYKKTGLEIFG